MAEKEVEMSVTGALTLKIPQQIWTGDETIKSSYFAGQSMFIKRSDTHPEEYELHYLGLKVSGFDTLEDAKLNAPAFGRSVFQILSEFIKE